MSVAAALALGVTSGLAHALEADHIAAVATFAARDSGLARALRSGAMWGVGHGLAVVGVGTALVLAGVKVPDALGVAFDLAVAGVLVLLGGLALRRMNPPPGDGARVAVGVVHGLSGTAALTVLVALHTRERAEAIGFLLVFGAATVAAMAAVSLGFGWSLRSATRLAPRLPVLARGLAGLGSIAAGVAVAVKALGEG